MFRRSRPNGVSTKKRVRLIVGEAGPLCDPCTSGDRRQQGRAARDSVEQRDALTA